MTGPEHYREAERLLGLVAQEGTPVPLSNAYTAHAQVHATLALAAATIEPAVSRWNGSEDDATIKAWSTTVSVPS